GAGELDHGQSVCLAADRPLVCLANVVGIHDGVVRVLLVGEQHGPVRVIVVDLDREVVVVVPELPALGLRALVVRVDAGRIGEQRGSPPHDRAPGIAFGDDELVDVVVDRIDGGEVEASCGGGRGTASGGARGGGHRDGQGSG